MLLYKLEHIRYYKNNDFSDQKIIGIYSSKELGEEDMHMHTWIDWDEANNCTEKAYDILTQAGVWDGRVEMSKTLFPDQMSVSFKLYKAWETLYKVKNEEYTPLVQSISTVKVKND